MTDEIKMLWGAFVLVIGVAFTWLARLQARVNDAPLQYITRVEADRRFADMHADLVAQEGRTDKTLARIEDTLLRIENKLEGKVDKT